MFKERFEEAWFKGREYALNPLMRCLFAGGTLPSVEISLIKSNIRCLEDQNIDNQGVRFERIGIKRYFYW
jgi:hypothetical protein